MFETVDWKLVAGIAGVASNIAFLPYLVDLLKRRTEPHLYTWIIWLITQGTATYAAWLGGAGWGVAGLTLGLVLVALVLVLSFWYGTKNVTRHDAVVLVAALAAVVVWWQLDSPALAVLMVSAIDALGYIPTFRKSWEEPWSETVSAWGLFAAGNFVSLFALGSVSIETSAYLVTILIANTLLTTVLLIRRKTIPKPI